MSIKDRGKLKWQPAMMLPEYVKLLNAVNKDYYRQQKPALDEYQLEEFENKIHAAMEFSSTIKFTVWEDGFDWDYVGLVHRLEPFTKVIHLELEKEKGHIIRVNFEDLVAVEVKD
ncbi:YolD-like family protein [Peribacillus sp. R9-11]|uniref:YolD-like family protein n=1 Tax=Peribacillus sp. R9-11 TaxID=3073271 RepID=UPI002868FCA3|nr:YolD-like family protein [Peribacillus sp. R9-11]WMX58110.1 YolD-like family protein [Peribacillus sp. R9-11]